MKQFFVIQGRRQKCPFSFPITFHQTTIPNRLFVLWKSVIPSWTHPPKPQRLQNMSQTSNRPCLSFSGSSPLLFVPLWFLSNSFYLKSSKLDSPQIFAFSQQFTRLCWNARQEPNAHSPPAKWPQKWAHSKIATLRLSVHVFVSSSLVHTVESRVRPCGEEWTWVMSHLVGGTKGIVMMVVLRVITKRDWSKLLYYW